MPAFFISSVALVYIHRYGNACMTHYLLNHFDVRLILAKPYVKRIAKDAATEMKDDNGFSLFFLNFQLAPI